jgi:pimeloyl-ACP methyl ester carboxylesterase
MRIIHRSILLIGLLALLAACTIQPRPVARQAPEAPTPTGTPTPEPTPEPTPTRTPRPTRTPVPEEPGYTPVFRKAECPVSVVGKRMECGFLVVPENRAKPQGKTIRLAVAIIRSTAQQPRSDPLIYLEGGPGGSALSSPGYWFEAPFRDERDIILFDQRGAGYSQPSLNCRELESYAYDDFMTAVRACRNRLRKAGVDLTQYHSAANAADVNDLRIALKLEQVNLFGVSYGTRAALTAMRDTPEGIRSVILDSTYPPQVNAYTEQARNGADAILKLLRACAADPACNRAYPQIEHVFLSLIERLDRDPAIIVVTNPFNGNDMEQEISGADLVDILFDSMYDSDALPFIPRAIADSARRRYATLRLLIDGVPSETYGSDLEVIELDETDGDVSDTEGVFYSVECHDESGVANQSNAESLLQDYPPALADALMRGIEQTLAICRVWGAGETPGLESNAVASPIPTLILAGEFDPITPPSWGRAALTNLARGYFFEFPAMSHGTLDSHPCPMQIALEFLNTPKATPNAGCIAEMSGVAWDIGR